MQRIVAIGGGDLRKLETFKIDSHIVHLTGKKQPTALFIPTASSDSEAYWETFQSIYGTKLGCKTQILFLLKDPPSSTKMKGLILKSDLIYVGGGNTLKMMNVWRRLGIDEMLKIAAQKGIVLSGLSAGAICWFKYGHSDSRSFHNPDSWTYIRVRGLGLINALLCPHFHSEKRERSLRDVIAKYGGMGLALNDCTALEIADNTFRVLSSSEHAKAYKVYKRKGDIVTDVLQPHKQYLPLDDLLEKS